MTSKNLKYPCIRKNIKEFYVVNFLDKPFKEIDDYVIVPASWVYVRHSPTLAVVTYPSNEKPIITRFRIKNRKKCGSAWRYYMACIKYVSESYMGAETWILKRANNKSGDEDLGFEGIQPTPVPENKLQNKTKSDEYSNRIIRKPRMIIRRPIVKISKLDMDKNRLKLSKSNKNSLPVNNKEVVADCLEHERSALVEVKKSNESSVFSEKVSSNTILDIKRSKLSKKSHSINASIKTTPAKPSNNKKNSRSVTHLKKINKMNIRYATRSSTRRLKSQKTSNLIPSQSINGENCTDATSSDGRKSDLNNESQLTNLSGKITPPKSSIKKKYSRTRLKRDKLRCIQYVSMPIRNQDKQVSNSTETLKLIQSLTSKGEVRVEATSINRKTSKVIEESPSIEVLVKSNTPKSFGDKICSSKAQNILPSKRKSDEITNYLNISKLVQSPAFNEKISIKSETDSTKPKYSDASQIDKYNASLTDEKGINLDSDCKKMISDPVTTEHKSDQKLHCCETHRVPSQAMPINKRMIQISSNGVSNLKSNVDFKKSFHPATPKLHHKLQAAGEINSSLKILNDRKQHHLIESQRSNGHHIPANMNPFSQPAEFLKVKPLSSLAICENQNPNAQRSHLDVSNHILTVHPQTSLVKQTLPLPKSQHTLQKCIPVQSYFESKHFDQNHLFRGIQKLEHKSIDNLAHQSSRFREQTQGVNQIQVQHKSHQQDINEVPNPIRSLQHTVQNVGFQAFENLSQQVKAPWNNKQYLSVNGNYTDNVHKYGLPQQHVRVTNPNHYYNPQYNKDRARLIAQNSSSNTNISDQACNFKRLYQKQNHQNYQADCLVCVQNDLLLRRKTNFQSPIESKKSKLSVPYTLSQVNSNIQENYNLPYVSVEPVSSNTVPQDRVKFCNRLHMSQPNMIQNNNIYQYSHAINHVDVENKMNKTTEVPVVKSQLKLEEDFIEVIAGSESQHTNWETDNDQMSNHQIGRVGKLLTNDASVNEVRQDVSIETNIPFGTNTINKSMNEQNISPKNKYFQSQMVAEQKILDLSGALFADLTSNTSQMLDMFHKLDNCINKSNEIYNDIAKKFEILNSLENTLLQACKGSDIVDNEPKIGTDTKEIDKVHQHRDDADDTKWTLKYRNYKDGLVELLPNTGIYVKDRALRKIKQNAKNPRMLARLLLTEIYSINALSKCSLTGTNRAFSYLNMEIRHGLDEHARMVLLKFVDKFTDDRKWDVCDKQAIMSSLRVKIRSIREKLGE